MTSPATTSSQLGIPKSEASLAEWTSKIRALQQQVDADEEAEHRKLEEEIAASRIARMRRSRGAGYGGGSRTNSIEFGDGDRLPKLGEDDGSTTDMKTIADRQRGQEDAMRKLTGNASPPSSVSMSLAAFMGGKATGPRLNKHAPQQDAHDPRQFEQRTRITSPHPVFGRGGVAMPGMVKQPSSPKNSNSDRDETLAGRVTSWKKDAGSSSPNSVPVRERITSSPFIGSSGPSSVVSRYTDVISQRPPSPPKSGSRDRERTMSSPNKSFPERISFPSTSADGRKTPLCEEATGGRTSPQKTGNRERRVSTPGRTSPSKVAFVLPPDSSDAKTAESPKKKRASFGSPTRPKTPRQEEVIPKSPPNKPAVETPCLARTIQPQLRSPPHAPQISVSQNPSPAFLKPPVTKETTPSLSRLQGRGFVQNMVKASQQLETTTSSTQTTPEKTLSAGRKPSVLDRWQPQVLTTPPTTSSIPQISSKPISMRKSWTADPVVSTSPEPRVQKPLRSATSFPSSKSDSNENQFKPSEQTLNTVPSQDLTLTGVGSATTLVFFEPVATEVDVTEFADVDELGTKPKKSAYFSEKLPMHTGKALNHPTKERAKKPKKPSIATVKAGEQANDSLIQFTARSLSIHEAEHVQDNGSAPVKTKLPSSPPSKVSPPSSNGVRTGRVTDRWSNQPIIDIKPVQLRDNYQPEAPKPSRMAGRKPLPGLAVTPSYPSTFNAGNRAVDKTPEASSPNVQSPRTQVESHRSVTPVRHTRIPSTGNRATVMDIAQVFDEETERPPTASPTEAEPAVEIDATFNGVPPESEDVTHHLPTLTASNLERRRSTFEKYAVPPLPPLKEEATPLSTPSGTLTRADSEGRKYLQGVFDGQVAQDVKVIPSEDDFKISKPDIPDASRIVHLSHVDHPLPSVDYSTLMKSRRTFHRKFSDVVSISVEVMSITGDSSTTLSQDADIFYDTEVLAIVHRSKSMSAGLVSTVVWGWFGKNSQKGERERYKLEELAKRYGTAMIPVHQYHEPLDLIQVLGDKLATRQGSRPHWSAENTAMHIVRSRRGQILIDEIDLNIKNLCSGFSCCLSILDTVYVWHGHGSTEMEREAALAYARNMKDNVVELSQGSNDEDEMFWIVLGEGSFASANYWQWKCDSSDVEPHIWRVDTNNVKSPVTAVETLQTEYARNFVHILDCVWEYFVMVGRSARGKRADIRLGLAVATEMSARVRNQRPYTPTIHTLVFPTQIPLDLKAHFRELDESLFNDNDVPDHMNILSREEALDHLRRKSWEQFALRDPSMLPLGMNAPPFIST
ncbi:hypothetical protein E1B28_000605 [Marasmius oreades]|uniref:Gelsolin repeat protein n=1 Tax=Marasmius oreades TaxID=181124 RepID=A0A9P7V1V7_9AGAR|nr:uncharacterized protein E1B28_000605 [Marasmius oreades]KAG7098692.1 hypothetical protein E1B28_000605 [Marasmius oreades]